VGASAALVRRFPDRARSIRRLEAEDATFRAICEDYAEALRALNSPLMKSSMAAEATTYGVWIAISTQY
jgi:hypothetical protein